MSKQVLTAAVPSFEIQVGPGLTAWEFRYWRKALDLWENGLLHWQREIYGRTQAGFARDVGAHPSQVGRWEDEATPQMPSEDHLVAIGGVFAKWAEAESEVSQGVLMNAMVNDFMGRSRLKPAEDPACWCSSGHHFTGIYSRTRGFKCRTCIDPAGLLALRPLSKN